MTDSDHDDGPDVALEPDVRALLADARMWEATPPGMADHVAAVVRSETPAPAAEEGSRWAMPGWARPALLGAAAVVLLFFGGVAMFSSVDETTGGTRVAALIPTGLVRDVEGQAEFHEFDAGVSIDLDAPSLPPLDGGRFYEGWVHTADGDAIPAGTFHSGDDVELWAAVDLDEVEEFTVTREESAEADSPEQGSSGDVVLKTTLVQD